MKVLVVGGGPAGLYSALLLRKSGHDVILLERDRDPARHGWGIGFSSAGLEALRVGDPESHAEIAQCAFPLTDCHIHVHGSTIVPRGQAFCMGRRTLVDILARHAQRAGADLRFGANIQETDDFDTIAGPVDLVIAADGANSAVRTHYAAAFQPTLQQRSARFLWLGTTRRFPAFSFIFVETDSGVFQAHAHSFDATHATFLVECDEHSWRAAGLDRLSAEDSVAACERLFAPWLDGHALSHAISPHRQSSPWSRFIAVRNRGWHHERVVLIGEAARTTHFSLGAGATLAMGDATLLSAKIREHGPGHLATALREFESSRRAATAAMEVEAWYSMLWFENVRARIHLAPQAFARSLQRRILAEEHDLSDATPMTREPPLQA